MRLANFDDANLRRSARAAVAAAARVERALEILGESVPEHLAAAGTLDVTVRTPAGAPTPAKVTVECIGDCPAIPAGTQRDVSLDGPLPAGAASAARSPITA